jgi:hypothetical protein
MAERFTIGTDPEFFLRRDEDGKFISAIPHINGTKEVPETLENGSNLQYDNVTLEFSTPAAINGEDLVNKVRDAFKDVKKKIPAECSLEAMPSANFEADELEDDEAQRFGCDPDYDAWKLRENEAPRCEDPSLRTCGGHIHVGKADGDNNDFLLDPYGKIDVVRLMDAVHGVISVILDDSEAAIVRRKLYGKAGSHRPVIKEAGGLYDGVEYRVLSNFWFKSPQLVMLMDSLTGDVLRMVRDLDYKRLITDIGEERICEIINKGLVKDAHKVLEDFVRPLLGEDSLYYLKECTTNIKNYNFKKEWELEV